MPNGGDASAAGPVDLRQTLDAWLERTPIVTRALSILTITCFFLGIAVGNQAIATVPLFVLENLELYRLIISPLFESHLLALLIVLFWLNRVGIKLENELGSRRVFTVFAQVSVSINLVFCAIVITLSQLIGAGYMMTLGCQGFFPTIVSLLVILPPQGPMSITFIPVMVPPKYAPYALIALSTILSGSLPLDLLCALVVGIFFKRVLARLTGLGVPFEGTGHDARQLHHNLCGSARKSYFITSGTSIPDGSDAPDYGRLRSRTDAGDYNKRRRVLGRSYGDKGVDSLM
ncbi:Rhomboid-related protein 4 [Hondaea fermentalgiana]|uniref:Rhomboid-related protein 4 n=1 Tax=Hondaea fermentalgiana TaxID=2315210 RepID=A0A2R5GRJ5_9STRA|nr:Rhomboid-related protein 4 [Hondaea fermentalgiana]|eukprot:GBG33215.1 Rhomboid-related protein 4 [Hondaea fermentalgiana]